MNFPKKALLGSLLALSATSVIAVDTADLRVIGTIAPTACTPTFAGGGTVDYGLIPTASLSSTSTTELAARPINYTITCDAPISIGTSWTDGRNGTGVLDGLHPANAFGLGQQGTANIGRYELRQSLTGTTGDGAAVDLIYQDNGESWNAATTGQIAHDYPRIQSYAPTGTLVPGAYMNIVGTINVIASIAATDTLDLTSAITLDGLSTMTVRYL